MAKLAVSRLLVQNLDVPQTRPSAFSLRVVLDGAPRTLDLQPFDVRDAKHKCYVDDGKGLHEVATAPSITYRGRVREEAQSFVAASWLDGAIEAVVRIDGASTSSTFVLQPLARVLRVPASPLHAVYRSKDNLAKPGRCGNVTANAKAVDSTPARPAAATVLATLAADADFEFYRANGSSVSATQNRIASLVNSVDAIFRQDVDVAIKVTSTIVRTSATYTSTDPRSLTVEVQTQWNRTHGNVARDLVHLFSGKVPPNDIHGYAILGSVCVRTDAYGVSMPNDSNESRNVGLVAHEVAHNFDALHCDALTPCNILCSRLGACSANLASFGSASKTAMIRFRDTRTCLESASPPLLTSVTPTTLSPFAAPTISVVGQRLSGVSEVVIGTQRIDVGSTNKSDTGFTFRLPPPPALGMLPFTVVSAAGPSNALPITLQASNPPELAVAGFAIAGFPLLFEFAGRERATWILIVAPDNTTFSYRGFGILQNFIPLAVGSLSAAGLGTHSPTIPTGVSGTLWSQLVTDRAGLFDGASALRSTTIF